VSASRSLPDDSSRPDDSNPGPRRRRLTRDIGEVARSVATDLHQRFPEQLVVCGLVRDFRTSGEQAQLTLASREPSERAPAGDGPSRIRVALRGAEFRAIRDQLASAGLDFEHLFGEGQAVVVDGRLRFLAERGVLELQAEQIDLDATAEVFSEIRAAAADRLRRAGLYERQTAVSMPRAPLRVGVVATAGSRGLAELLDTLSQAAVEVRHTVFHAPVEGERAASALADGVSRATANETDVVCLVRDSAPTLRQAPFDGEALARAIAEAPVPVLTGLSHDGEPTLAEQVAHRACPGPAGAAEVITSRLRRSIDELGEAEARVRTSAATTLDHTRAQLEQAYSRVRQAAEEVDEPVRAAAQQRRRRTLSIGAAIVVGLAALVIAVMPSLQLLGAGLAVLVVVGGLYALITRRRRGSYDEEAAMQIQQMTFDQALAALEEVQASLEQAERPEEVTGLMRRADDISHHCRRLLGKADEAVAAHESTAEIDIREQARPTGQLRSEQEDTPR
jgi:exodeoxyribonuclease VII large subunit